MPRPRTAGSQGASKACHGSKGAFRVHCCLALLLPVCISATSARAGEFPIHTEVGGYSKTLFVVTSYYDSDLLPDDPDASAVLSERLKLRFDLPDDISLNAHYELSPRAAISAQSSFFAMEDASLVRPRAYDLEKDLVSGGSFELTQNLDRLYLTWALPWLDLTLGRQAISFGSARVFNPEDFLAPFSFLDVDQEEKPGVDAARVTIPLGQLSEFEMLYVAGEEFDWEKSGAALRFRTAIRDVDLGVIEAVFHNTFVVGTDVATNLFGMGFWLEATATLPEVTQDRASSEKSYVRTTTGLDYNFPFDLYVFLEYAYASFGVEEPADYLIDVPAPVLRGEAFTLGQHYLTPGLRYSPHPLLSLDLMGITNLQDPSTLLTFRAEYSVTDNTALAAGIFLGLGERPEVEVTEYGPVVTPKSEFGLYPASVFLQTRLYF